MRENIIIIPAYKPNMGLLDIVRSLKQIFKYLIIVNDGSGDEYLNIFHDVESMGCTVLHHYVNMGKGRALKTAFNEAIHIMKEHGEVSWGGVITADADGQHMIEDIVKISNILEADEDSLVLGCREFDSKQVPFKSKFGNTLTRFVFKYLCGLSISDTQTGLRGIPKKLLPLSCQVDGERYEYETNVLLKMKSESVNIREVTINTVYENNNSESHFNPLRDSVKIYAVILKYMCSSILSVIIDYTVFFLVAYFTENIFVMTYSGRACSSLVNFMTNKNIVFKSSGNWLPQLVKYMVLVLISGTISAVAVSLLQSIIGCNLLVTKVIVELILFFVNFYIQRNLIFVKKEG